DYQGGERTGRPPAGPERPTRQRGTPGRPSKPGAPTRRTAGSQTSSSTAFRWSRTPGKSSTRQSSVQNAASGRRSPFVARVTGVGGQRLLENKGRGLDMKRLLIAALAVLAGFAGPAQAQKTLVVAIAADAGGGLDPEAVLNNTSGFVMATIYDSLVKYKPGTVDVGPALAESWDVSSDGLTWTFHLRKGVKYHYGTPFNAANYIKTIKRLMVDKKDPASIYAISAPLPVENYVDDTYSTVTSYVALDDNTVQFKLKEPNGPFPTNLAMVWNGVVSPDAWDKYKKDFRNHPVGTGPFVFKEWRP